jgi:hypothetical protein
MNITRRILTFKFYPGKNPVSQEGLLSDNEHGAALSGTKRLAAGAAETITRTVKRRRKQDSGTPFPVFNCATRRAVDATGADA